MPGLYDAYQLANSNQVQQYQGSAMPEMMRVADVMQNRYDLAEQGMQGLGDAVKNGRGAVLQGDQELYDQRSKFYNDQIKQYASRPDLENVAKQVVRMGRNWGNEYSNFTSRVGQYQGYRAELDKAVDKGHIDQGTADSLLGMATDQSGKMTYNPETGQYDNVRFNGIIPAHRVDINEWTKKAAGDIVGQTVESVNKTEQGDYLVKTTQGYTRLPAAKIESYMQKAYQLDPEIQADFNQRAKIASWKAGRMGMKFSDIPDNVTITDPKTGKLVSTPNSLKQQVQDAAEKQGISPDALVPNYVHEATLRQSQGDLFGYGTKYSKNDWHGGSEIDGESIAGKKKETAVDMDRFSMQGNVMQFSPKVGDATELQKNIDNYSGTISSLETKLAHSKNLTDDEINDVRKQINETKFQKQASESILSGARDDQARAMGYKNYDEFQSHVKEKNGYKGAIPKVGDKGPLGGTVASVTTNTKGQTEVTYDNGTKSVLTNPHTKQGAIGYSDPEMQAFDAGIKDRVKNGANKYGVQPTETQLTDQESDGLKKMIQANPSLVQWKDPNNVGGDPVDAPKDFAVGNVKIVQQNGKYYLSANELSTDKSTKGAPTGKSYTLEVPPGSTVGTHIAKNMLMKNGNPKNPNIDRNALAQASVLIGDDMSGLIGNLANNESVVIPSRSGNAVATVKRKSLNTSGTIKYDVYDENGNLVNQKLDAIDPSLRDDATKLSLFLKHAQADDELQDAKKKK